MIIETIMLLSSKFKFTKLSVVDSIRILLNYTSISDSYNFLNFSNSSVGERRMIENCEKYVSN